MRVHGLARRTLLPPTGGVQRRREAHRRRQGTVDQRQEQERTKRAGSTGGTGIARRWACGAAAPATRFHCSVCVGGAAWQPKAASDAARPASPPTPPHPRPLPPPPLPPPPPPPPRARVCTAPMLALPHSLSAERAIKVCCLPTPCQPPADD